MNSREETAQHPAPTAQFTPLSAARARLGESPIWSPEHRAIWWVDILGSRLLRTSLDGTTDHWDTPEIPGFVQCLGGTLLVGMQSGIFRFEPASARFDKVVALNETGQRFNDACIDPHGRIWAGTMDLENRRANGVLYLFDANRKALTPMLDGFRTVNGLAWDAHRNRLFVSDSHPSVQTVWTCPASPGDGIGERSVFARFNGLDGRPDGAAIDDAGGYWIAGVGGGTLYRFAPDGTLAAQFTVPVASPTKPALVADSGNRALVLTSFEDDGLGGRLLIWRNPPLTPVPERHSNEKDAR